MITIAVCSPEEQCQAQIAVTNHHYLHRPVDARCSVFAYRAALDGAPIGYLIFGRPEATRCFSGGLTYGGLDDIIDWRADYSRWTVMNLARVWLDPSVQSGGLLHHPDLLPGFRDRKGRWRSTLASWLVDQVLDRLVGDYLLKFPPCFLDEPWRLTTCISYCDTRIHRGTLYQAAGFSLVRTNDQGIQTWARPLRDTTPEEDLQIVRASRRSARSQRYRAQRRQIELVI